MKALNVVLNKLDDAEFLRKFHGVCTLIWLVMIPVTVLTGLKESIAWISFMSITALFLGSFSSWQSSRAEVKIDEQNNTAELK